MKMGQNVLLAVKNMYVLMSYYLITCFVNDILWEYVDINFMFETFFLAFV